MSEFVLNISQSGFIQELEKTSSLSEKIKKLDDCIGRIEEKKKKCAENVKQLEEFQKLLDKQIKESNAEAGRHELELTFFCTLRQKLGEFSSIPPPESFVPPPTHPFTTAQSRFVYPPPQGSFMPPPTHSFTTAQPRFVIPPPPESLMPPPTYSLRPPAFPVPPPPTASNFPQPSLFANPPWVSSGPPFSGPQPTWGPLYGPVPPPPVQEGVQVLEPRVRFQWTEERARSFDEAVIAVGGLHNATPKSIKQAMVIDEEVTEKQISSRLQKLRGKLPI